MQKIYKVLRMRFGWYVGWVFGLGFIVLPVLALRYAINEHTALWFWIVTCVFLAILIPLGCLIIKCVIEEYQSTGNRR